MERRDEAWINPDEQKMGYNGKFFELDDDDEMEIEVELEDDDS
jgi:hypothetical protein